MPSVNLSKLYAVDGRYLAARSPRSLKKTWRQLHHHSLASLTQPCASGAFTDPPRDTTSFTLTLYDTMMPKISLLAPSFNLHTTHQSVVGTDKHSSSLYNAHGCVCLAVGGDSQRAGGQVGVLVLQLPVQRQATFLPVAGQKWRERENFAEGGTRCHDVTADRKWVFDQGPVGGAGGAREAGQDSLGLLGGHRTLVLSRVEQADVCILPHCRNTEQPSAAPPIGRTRRAGVLAYLRSSSSSPSCWCCW